MWKRERRILPKTLLYMVILMIPISSICCSGKFEGEPGHSPGPGPIASNPLLAGEVLDLYSDAVLPEAPVGLSKNGEVVSTWITDEQGRFSCSELQSGIYLLAVSHSLYESSTMMLQIAPGSNTVSVKMIRKGLAGQVAFSSVKQKKRDITVLSVPSGEIYQVTVDGTGNFRPSLSPDGSLVLWAHEQDDVKKICLGNVTEGTEAVAVTAGPSDDYPAWAPDGSMFAFQSVRAGTNRIIVMDVNGTELADLGPGRFPTWSPDGSRISFISSGRIIVADWQGEAKSNLGDHTSVYYPAWSPDGNMLAYSAKEGDAAYILYIFDIESNISWPLITAKSHLRSSFAPNGQWIAFHAVLPEISSAAQIYAMEVGEPDKTEGGIDLYQSGRPVLRLSLDSGEHRDPSWSH